MQKQKTIIFKKILQLRKMEAYFKCYFSYIIFAIQFVFTSDKKYIEDHDIESERPNIIEIEK